jgi:DNA-binding transcriptional regulator YiaG
MLLWTLKPASPDVVIYYANRLAPAEATQLGRLVGETRPNHTSVVFEAKAAAASVLRHSRSSRQGNGSASSASRTRQLREHFGLTQTELAHSLGVGLRTVQNWERAGVAGSPRQLRDLEELLDHSEGVDQGLGYSGLAAIGKRRRRRTASARASERRESSRHHRRILAPSGR